MKDLPENRKYLLYFALTILIDGLIYLSIGHFDAFANGIGVISSFIRLFWLFEITKRSGIFRLTIGRLLYISFAILMIGALAKLEHWWWASYALIIGMCCAGLIYMIRFFLKKNIQLIDIVKLLFFELTLFLALSKLEHYNVESYEMYKLGIYYLMIFLFAIEKNPNKTSNKNFLLNRRSYR